MSDGNGKLTTLCRWCSGNATLHKERPRVYKTGARTMKRQTTCICFIWIMSLMPLGAAAQDLSPRFRHLTIDDGLSQSAVYALLQDRQGFVWIGTMDGLNQYDGYDFTIYKNVPSDSNSLSNNYITALFEDSRGYLWVGTLAGGLNRLDRISGHFRHYRHSSDAPNSISDDHVTAIAEDSSGALWIGTSLGLNRLTVSEAESPQPRFNRYFHEPLNSQSLSHDSIESLLIDARGRLWVGTASGLDRSTSLSGGASPLFQRFVLEEKSDVPGGDSGVPSLYPSRDGSIWAGSASGLTRLHAETGAMQAFPHHYSKYRRGWGKVLDIEEDKNGRLWLTTPAELMIFDPVRQQYQSIRREKMNPHSLSSNQLTRLLRDHSGVLWIGSNGYGLNLYDPKADRFFTYQRPINFPSRINRFSITSVMQDREGMVWISADVLYRWNRTTGELKSFETSSDQPKDFGNTGSWSMLQDEQGFIWLAGFEGVYRYDPHSGTHRHFAKGAGLKEKLAFRVYLDKGNRIWVATKNYFSRYDRETDRFHHYSYRENPPSRFAPITDIYQDEAGIFWLATDDGLARLDARTGIPRHFRNDPQDVNSLSNNVVLCITPDPTLSDVLWLGTAGGGLNRFSRAKQSFRAYTEADGLPNDVVYAALPDKNGNLWLSTNKGLARFNQATAEFRNFDVSDGLQSNEFNSGAYFLSSAGEMFFGGIKGLNYFFPASIVDNPHIPNVEITGIRLFNQVISTKSHPQILDSLITHKRRLTLSYRENVVAFEFSALDYSAPSRNRYAYRLWGLDERWLQAGTDRLATYTHLPAGDYLFQVKGSNNDDIWNEQGASLAIHITPPPWQTWWAYAMYGIVALGLLYGIRSYEMNRIRLRNRLELEHLAGKKLRNLDQMKSRFFANISHEFRTPLTLILGQVDRVMNDTEDGTEKNRLEIALRNARRLLHLVNQLLDLSKIEAGSMHFEAVPVNIIPVLKNVVSSFESLAEQKNIAFRFRCPVTHAVVAGEPDKLENIFYNLLSNAFKFTPHGGTIEVRIEVPVCSVNGKQTGASDRLRSVPPRLQIHICDSGPGIAREQLPHIFDRFYQVDSSSTREQEGSGIGLALAKELAELHGGEISVSSEVSRGTTFTVSLPIVPSDAEAESTDVAAKQAAPGTHEFHSIYPAADLQDILETNGEEEGIQEHKTDAPIVLVVDDNADVRRYIRDQLEPAYMVLQAENGKNGIAMARDSIPDLLITDVMMPEMDGYTLSRMLKSDERTCHIPIIILTAKAGIENKIEGLETGADDYLVKPFSAKELIVRVRNLIESRRLLRARFREVTLVKPEEVTSVPMDQALLAKVMRAVEDKIGDDLFNAAVLAESVGMSISQLNRKLRALIDQPAGQLIRSMRLHRAADLLKQNAGNVAEICYQVGFADQANFSRAFKKQFGMAPGAYKRRQG